MIARRTRSVMLLVILTLLLILIIWLLISFFSQGPAEQTDQPAETPDQQEQVSKETIQDVILEEEQEERQTAAGATSIAKTFVERYGSYSNESNFQNLRDLLPLMTDSFRQETTTFLASATTPEEYSSITTRVITVDMESYDEEEGVATVVMNTQREEATGSPQNILVRFQEIELTMIRRSEIGRAHV